VILLAVEYFVQYPFLSCLFMLHISLLNQAVSTLRILHSSSFFKHQHSDPYTSTDTTKVSYRLTLYITIYTVSQKLRLAQSLISCCRLKALGRKINLSGISLAKGSRSGPNSVYVDMSRDDNVQGILGTIGPFWAKWGLGRVPRSASFFVW